MEISQRIIYTLASNCRHRHNHHTPDEESPSSQSDYLITKMPGRLEGQIALISGSSQGFGRGILETFLREGALVLGLDLQAVDGPVEGFPENRAYQITANVAEEETWKRAVTGLDPCRCAALTMYTSWKPVSQDSGKRRRSSSTMLAGRTLTNLVSM